MKEIVFFQQEHRGNYCFDLEKIKIKPKYHKVAYSKKVKYWFTAILKVVCTHHSNDSIF